MPDPMAQIRQIIEAGNHFLVASHTNPDGDAMGSQVAMGHVLATLGKDFRLYSASGLPDHFAWLDLPGPVYSSLESLEPFVPDWYIVLDCGDPFRIGKELMQAVTPSKIINIDHHVGNPHFGAAAWVDPRHAAVGEMVALLAKNFGIPLTGGLGQAVYLALVADTGHFAYGNTRPETLELAAEIVRLGLDPGQFTAMYQNQWTVSRMRLWSVALGQTRLFCKAKVAVLQVSAEVMEGTGTTSFDCEGLVEFIRRIRGVRVAMLLREDGPRRIKFSLRSHGDDDVQRVALEFGGGGHRNASAGFVIDTMDAAQTVLLGAISRVLGLVDDDCPESARA